MCNIPNHQTFVCNPRREGAGNSAGEPKPWKYKNFSATDSARNMDKNKRNKKSGKY
jgi:hypothetical protein